MYGHQLIYLSGHVFATMIGGYWSADGAVIGWFSGARLLVFDFLDYSVIRRCDCVHCSFAGLAPLEMPVETAMRDSVLVGTAAADEWRQA